MPFGSPQNKSYIAHSHCIDYVLPCHSYGSVEPRAKTILRWIYKDWQKMMGYQDKNIQFIFPELDLSNELDVKKILLELFLELRPPVILPGLFGAIRISRFFFSPTFGIQNVGGNPKGYQIISCS